MTRAHIGTLIFRLDDDEEFMRCIWKGRDDQLVEVAAIRANMLDELSIERFRDLYRDLTEVFAREVFSGAPIQFTPKE